MDDEVKKPSQGGWCVGVTRGTTLSSQHANSSEYFFNITSGYGDVVVATRLFLWVWILHPKNETDGFPWKDFAHCISFNLYLCKILEFWF